MYVKIFCFLIKLQIMSLILISLIVLIFIGNIASEILWCETDFSDISDWITDGGLAPSTKNDCQENGYNKCGHLDPNNGDYMQRNTDASRYINIKIRFTAFLAGDLENGEGFYVDSRCGGNWIRLLSFTNVGLFDAQFIGTELDLPSQCNLYNDVSVRFMFIADSEDMYFNDVCLTGDLTSSPTNNPILSTTIDPTMNPSIIPTETRTDIPTMIQTNIPSNIPTETASDIPSLMPTNGPTIYPSSTPTIYPSITPIVTPVIDSPTNNPSIQPTVIPTILPTSNPTTHPSLFPSNLSPKNSNSSQQPSFKKSFWIIIGCIGIFCVILMVFLFVICMRYYSTKKHLISKTNNNNKPVPSLPASNIIALSNSIKSSDIESMYASIQQPTNSSPFECEYEHESHNQTTNGNTGIILKNQTKGVIDFDNEYEN